MSAKSYSDITPIIDSIKELSKSIDAATEAMLVSSAKVIHRRVLLLDPAATPAVKVAPSGKYGKVKLVGTVRGKYERSTPSAKGKFLAVAKGLGIKDARAQYVKLVKGGKAELVKAAHRKTDYMEAACPPPPACRKVKVPKC